MKLIGIDIDYLFFNLSGKICEFAVTRLPIFLWKKLRLTTTKKVRLLMFKYICTVTVNEVPTALIV